MQRTHSLFFKYLLFAVFVLSLIYHYPYCFAEDSPNKDNQKDPTYSAETDLRKKVIDFSNGEQGFKLSNLWKIQADEFQFIPNEKTKSQFYCNSFREYTLPNYVISVKARWIDGPDYSPYGLLFKYKNDNYYAFVIQLDSYVYLYKYDNGKWKTIKSMKNKNSTNNQYDSLKVICEGTSIICFLNEKKIFETMDKNPINDTYVGLCSDGNIQCGFKDFSIEELSVPN